MSDDSAQWTRVKQVFQAALERPPEQRLRFARERCGGDLALFHEVESLLTAHDLAGDFAERPAVDAYITTSAPVRIHANSATVERVLQPGSLLGPYLVGDWIGAGGMGEVYRARDTRLGRIVAIKVLSPQVAIDADSRQRFEREAQTLAALSHPHICPVFDVGQQDGIDYLVMEYLEGETLSKRLSRGPLPLDLVFRHALEIADALIETHAQGIVHRDLKPGNIMLTKSGAMLLDFGLAKLKKSITVSHETRAAISESGTGRRPSTTRAGTLAYMAPEQIRGQRVDHRADVFSFGAILFEMVTGEMAFDLDGRTTSSVLELPPPVPLRSSDMSPPLHALIQRCLRKDPDARSQDMRGITDELRAIAATVAASQAGRPWLRKRAAIVLSALTVAVVAGGVATWQTGIAGKLARLSAGDSLLPAARPPHLGNMKPLTGEDQLEIDPAISPDGKSVAYAAGTATHVRIYIRSVGGGPARPLREATTLQFQPRWSPDGTRMLYISPEGVFVAPVDGGAAQQILSRTDVPEKDIVVRMRSGISAAAWGPDGQRVAIADNSDRSLSLVSVDDGRRQVIATSQHELHSCDWSPDGKWIACTSGNWHFAGVGWTFGNAAPSAIVLVPAAGGDLIELTDRLARNSSPTWARDSTTLLFVSDSQGASDVYSLEVGEDGQPRGGATRITTGLNAYSIHFSAGGDRLVYAAFSARANIWSMPIPSSVADASAADPVTRGNQTIESMRVSRDGKWLLYDSNLNGSFDIFRVPIGGGPVERLTTDPGDEFVPDLSPDGQRLAYHSWRTKTRDIFVQLLDGGPPEQVTATSSHEAFPVWSPDGQSLAFVDLSEERGVFRGAFLTRRDEVGRWGTPVALRVGAWKVFWSPDGRFLAYSRGDAVEVVFPETGASRIVYAPASHSAQPKAEDVLVGADGRTLYFKSHDAEGRASIWSVPLAGGTPRLLVKFDDPTRRSSRTDFAVGGGRFFFAIDDHRSNIWVADVAVN